MKIKVEKPVENIFSAMRSQLLGQLRATGFVRARGGSDIRDLNTNSENWAVVKVGVVNLTVCFRAAN